MRVATKLEEAKQDVDRRLAGNGVAYSDVRLEVGLDGAVDWRRWLAVVIADAAAGCRNDGRQSEELQKVVQALLPYDET
ncbi:hypothetical protein D3C81_1601230 [compost metagenome]